MNSCDGAVDALLLPAVDDDSRAARCKSFGDRQADARRRARDKRRLADKVDFHLIRSIC